MSASRLVLPMASGSHRRRDRQPSGGETPVPPVSSDGVRELLPWWSKLVHQALLAEATTLAAESEERDDCEDRSVASTATRVRLRAAVDGCSGLRARRIN
jgi:hypothetical protein